MICSNCKTDRNDSDFFIIHEFCYKCEYQKKIEKMKPNKKSKCKNCRMCGNLIVLDPNAKRRQRSIFCSYECAEKGHKKQINQYWTRSLAKKGKENGLNIFN